MRRDEVKHDTVDIFTDHTKWVHSVQNRDILSLLNGAWQGEIGLTPYLTCFI